MQYVISSTMHAICAVECYQSYEHLVISKHHIVVIASDGTGIHLGRSKCLDIPGVATIGISIKIPHSVMIHKLIILNIDILMFQAISPLILTNVPTLYTHTHRHSYIHNDKSSHACMHKNACMHMLKACIY